MVARLKRALALGAAGGVGIEVRQRRHRDDLAGLDVEHDAGAAFGAHRGDGGGELALHRRLDPAVDRQRHRAAALRGIGEPRLEHPLHAGDALAVEIGPAEDVAGQRGLRIEPLGLAVEDDGRLAERVDRLDQLGKRAAFEIEKLLPELSSARYSATLRSGISR